jgi:hypothetical protein
MVTSHTIKVAQNHVDAPLIVTPVVSRFVGASATNVDANPIHRAPDAAGLRARAQLGVHHRARPHPGGRRHASAGERVLSVALIRARDFTLERFPG